MKTYLSILLILTGINFSNAQRFGYGITAGTNFTTGGQITGNPIREGDELVYWNGTSQGQSKAGFHGGAFMEVNFGGFFVRPELVYTSIKSEFVFPNRTSTYSIEKFDVPLLFGYNVADVVGLYAGPVYTPMFKNSFDYKESTIVKEEGVTRFYKGNSLQEPDIPVNLQLGIKSEFSGIGIDLRYEYNLSSPTPEKIDIWNQDIGRDPNGVNVATVEDARLSQLILSLSYDFSDLYSSSSDSRRRGRYSYSRRRRAR